MIFVLDPAGLQNTFRAEDVVGMSDFLKTCESIAFFAEIVGFAADRLPAALEVFAAGEPEAVLAL